MRLSTVRWLRFVAAVGAQWCFAIFALAQAPEAGPEPTLVRWEAPPECPPAQDVVEEIERLLGRPLEPQGGIRVRGVIETHDDGFDLEVVLQQGDAQSHRELSDPSCEGLSRAGALVIALAIDPTVLMSLADTSVHPAGAVAAADAALASALSAPRERGDAIAEPGGVLPGDGAHGAASEAAASEAGSMSHAGASVGDGPSGSDSAPPDSSEPTEPGPAPAPRFVGQLFGLLSAGPLPSVSPGGGLSVGFGYDALELTLGAYGASPQEGRLSDVASGGTVGLAAGTLRGCASFEVLDELLEVLPCASFEAGAAWATGVGVPVVRSGFAPWLAVGAGARIRVWFFDGVGLEALAELQVPLVRAPFVLMLDGARREFHRASEVGGVFGLGAVFRVR